MTFTARGKNYDNRNLNRNGDRKYPNNAGKNQVRF
jgi:hypothetical protein